MGYNIEEKVLYYIKTSKNKAISIKNNEIHYDEYENHIYKKAGFSEDDKSIIPTLTKNEKFYIYRKNNFYIVKENDGSELIEYFDYIKKEKIMIEKSNLKKHSHSIENMGSKIDFEFQETFFNTVRININAYEKKLSLTKEIELNKNQLFSLLNKIKNNINFFEELDLEFGDDEGIMIANFIFIDHDYFDKSYYGRLYMYIKDDMIEVYFEKEEYEKISKILTDFID